MERRKLSRTVLALAVSFVMNIIDAKAQVVSVYAGNGAVEYNGEHINAALAGIGKVTAAARDGQGNMFYADATNSRIRKISPDGIVTTIAGTGNTGYTADGVKAIEAAIGQPAGLAIDKEGNIYFSEYLNACVRKIGKDGVLTTVAGTSVSGYSGNGGKATLAQLQGPCAIAFDKEGSLYISDADNNCVRKVNTSGIISLYAGNAKGYGTGRGGYGGDGGKAVMAQLNQPGSLVFDRAGNLYIADCFNHCVRKVTAGGMISTLAGTGEGGYSGDDESAVKAKLSFPDGLAVSSTGDVYIADHGNSRVRMVNPAGIIVTVAGNGKVTKAFGKPSFIAAGGDNSLFVGDNSNNKIMLVKEDTAGITSSSATGTATHISGTTIDVSSHGGSQ